MGDKKPPPPPEPRPEVREKVRDLLMHSDAFASLPEAKRPEKARKKPKRGQ